MTCASLAVSVFTLDDSGLLTHHLDLAAGQLLALLPYPVPLLPLADADRQRSLRRPDAETMRKKNRATMNFRWAVHGRSPAFAAQHKVVAMLTMQFLLCFVRAEGPGWCSPTDFGAKGNGIHIDTDATNRALAARNCSTVALPDGRAFVSGTIQL